MQNPVAHAGFVDSSQFWIADAECGIMGMLIGLIFEFLVQLKQIVFEIEFELQNIRFSHFSRIELPPR